VNTHYVNCVSILGLFVCDYCQKCVSYSVCSDQFVEIVKLVSVKAELCLSVQWDYWLVCV
jgi:hypothetical protein